MRKLKRNIARTRMLNAGYTRINKRWDDKGRSFFAREWRNWL
ncbi:MAG: hypothetical protein WHF31_16190 [Candidatus Dehalobacter alkaniphilus]|jgi:hypothetical protein